MHFVLEAVWASPSLPLRDPEPEDAVRSRELGALTCRLREGDRGPIVEWYSREARDDYRSMYEVSSVE